jgi:alginate O-acetyltransferase complex protein AlgI
MYLIPGKYQWLWLLVCSIIFYLFLLPGYLTLFLILIVVNFYLGKAIEQSENKRNINFILGISINIFVLAFFKYFGFFRAIASDIYELSGDNHLLKIILPVGLSFFIFTILSYLIEVKRGSIKAENHIGIFASSLLFFPKIMQGPIEKPMKIFPQFRESKSFEYEKVIAGMKQMLWGYFKKLVVADRLAIYVNAVYGNYEQHTGLSLLLATILYSFQIYADFSGYTDIALGSAKVLGFNLTNNFNRPYFATSIKDFWSRWHISLSVWLRDYLFLPLAIFLTGKVKKTKYLGLAAEKWVFMVATILTFTICGLWHGEGLNFLIWGLLFGFYLTFANLILGVNKNLRNRLGLSKKSIFYRIYGIVVTFLLVSFAWIFFKADSTQDAFSIVSNIFSFDGPIFIDFSVLFYGLPAVAFMLLIEARAERKMGSNFPFRTNHWIKEELAYGGLAVVIILTGVFDGGQFIYFQF